VFVTQKADRFIEAALNARAIRQDLISSNIANISTPGYRPRDIHFEGVLADQAQRAFNQQGRTKLAMARSDESHLSPPQPAGQKPVLFYRDGHMARNDGNSVDLDVETSELAKNGVMYEALTAIYQKRRAIFHAVIDAGKNL
jgi:flagellar basal-body rod protein FlgB